MNPNAVIALIVLLVVGGTAKESSGLEHSSLSTHGQHSHGRTSNSGFFGNGNGQENRERLEVEHDLRHVKRWSMAHWASTYAGAYASARQKIVVGFTQGQVAKIRRLRALPSLYGHNRVVGLVSIPRYSLADLKELNSAITRDVARNPSYSGLIVSRAIEVRRNRLSVSTTHLRKTRAVLRRLYGRAAPLRVEYEEPPVEL